MTPEVRSRLETLQAKARETNGNLSLEECREIISILREGRLSIPALKKAEAKEKRTLAKESALASAPQISFEDI